MPCFMEHMKTWQTAKEVPPNLTPCKIFNSKTDACLRGWYNIWHVVKTVIQNLTRRNFSFQIMLSRRNYTFKIKLFRKVFSSKTSFLKLHVKRNICEFYGINWIIAWFFVCESFFKICFLILEFSSKSCFSKTIFSSKCFLKIYFPRKSDVS